MSTMSEQLKEIKKDLYGKRKSTVLNLPPSKWKEDGVDHINIWEYAKTDLGVFLSHGSKYSFHHSVFGNFKSIEGFWKYIQSETKDDRLRFMTGTNLRRFFKKLKTVRVNNFKALIMDASYQKLLKHDKFVAQMKESTLPFDCYYVTDNSNVRIRPVFSWIVDGMEEIRLALKEDREPDFSFLKDKKQLGIYDHALELTKKPAVVADIDGNK